ncbi:MAG: 16S rRNA (cytosine(1402)-N(4))-methyltransferase RsmH [Lachnospiraceae bacterium]|nr:16S rRNA (cytosine(1402)-N(4))-methyltransferase RsmH [Lachnospiraceae bacterium]
MKFEHTSVLLEEVLDNLAIRPDGIYVDGTLGGGGHSYHILERLTEGGRLIGIDQDTDAIAAAGERLAQFGDAVTIVHDNYENIAGVLSDLSIRKVNGILLDLGVSSYQLDNPERGFTYRTDAPLDMRMDRSSSLTAKEIVNTYSAEELTRILREYGEEKCAARIAANIVKRRAVRPLETTGDLSEIVRASIPAKMREKGGNPDKRTFQAIRIACNRELDVLRDSLDTMIDLLAPGGRLCVITFHSLEDRIVKNAFRRAEKPCTCPPEFPVCVCGKKSKGTVVTRKAIAPSAHELEVNRRSASAKLRVFERGEI